MNLTVIVVCLSLCFAGEEEPRINQIQLIGTHNSYHKVSQFVRENIKVLDCFELLNYELPPIKEQLDVGIRAFELDLHYHNTDGWLVLHIPQIDPESNCKKLRECLLEFKEWSNKHPKHLPVFVILDLTNEFVKWEGFKIPSLNELGELETLLLEIFEKDKIITPDNIRGNYDTLEEAVLNNNWMKLSESRGKFLFIFHNKSRLRRLYTNDDRALKGKLMFVNSIPGEGYTSIIISMNPSVEVMSSWVQKGYFVITFGCDPKLMNKDRCSQFDEMAFATGAQVIQTDYPPSSPHPKTGYFLTFPDGSTFRWNPLIPPNCSEQLIEYLNK